jgi:hypothetical protein
MVFCPHVVTHSHTHACIHHCLLGGGALALVQPPTPRQEHLSRVGLCVCVPPYQVSSRTRS